MAGGGGGASGARELDQTPTWAVAAVCASIVLISIILEKVLHKVGEVFQERKKKALYEALEKVKGELMVLGFISLLLTFGQSYISRICIPIGYADSMLPCVGRHGGPQEATNSLERGKNEHHRRLLWYGRRVLSAEASSASCKAGHVPLVSINGLHQLHIFIFFLAVFHVLYSAITMTLGRLKIRGWKEWERGDGQHTDFMNDPTRFRLTHETSFVKGHASSWNKTAVTFYCVCFFRQFFRSVRKTDYLTMRHGFVTVHLAPGSNFDFQKYIKRSLEDDFKVVVGITPLLWTSLVLFLLVNVDGWQTMFWLSLFPLFVILAVGTKLQAIIAQMALEINERHAVVQGIPLVQVSDRNFWFAWPELILHLIHYVLFQNAFEITYFFWIWYEFGLRSCFHRNFAATIVRVALGVGVQFLCSYITLPLYALVTQMGSTMKKSIFDEQTSKALKQWHKKALQKKTEGKVKSPTMTLGGSPTESPALTPLAGQAGMGYEVADLEAERSPQPAANSTAGVNLQETRPRTNSDLLTGP